MKIYQYSYVTNIVCALQFFFFFNKVEVFLMLKNKIQVNKYYRSYSMIVQQFLYWAVCSAADRKKPVGVVQKERFL